TSRRLTGYLDGPGVKQVCLLERVRRSRGKQTTETVCALTSLGPERASAGRLLRIARGHWEIENRLHWVRDVVLGEDRCRGPTGAAPEGPPAPPQPGTRLVRSTRPTPIAPALRRHAAKPPEALRLVMSFAPS